MDREWQELDLYNLPSDILKPGAWEFRVEIKRFTFPAVFTPTGSDPHQITGMMARFMDPNGDIQSIKIRRPEGWKPSECPTCGSDEKRKYIPPKCSSPLDSYDPWHDQPKAPTHEDIMTKWWRSDEGAWYRPASYHEGFYGLPNNTFDIPIKNVNADWFINRESADIPPEA